MDNLKTFETELDVIIKEYEYYEQMLKYTDPNDKMDLETYIQEMETSIDMLSGIICILKTYDTKFKGI